jgi:hypothetical protein
VTGIRLEGIGMRLAIAVVGLTGAVLAANAAQQTGRGRGPIDPNSQIELDITPRPSTGGGPLLIAGVVGDASRDAAGETQLFELIFVAGATDYARAAQGLAIDDMDRDGGLDLFAYQDRPRLLLNRGGFRFEEHPLDLPGPTGTQSPTLADFNGDGFLDIFTAGLGQRNSNLFVSQGRFDRFAEVGVAMGLGNAGCYCRGQVSVGDVNGDGYLDLAIAANAIGTSGENGLRPLSRLWVYRPSSDGVFERGRFEDVGGTDVIPGFGGVDPKTPDPKRDVNGMSAMLRDWDDDGDLDFARVGHNDMLRGDPLSPFATGGSPYGVFTWRGLLRDEGRLRFEAIEPGTPGAIAERGQARWDASKGYYVHDSAAIAAETIMSADTDNDGDLDVLITGVNNPGVFVHSLWEVVRFWRNDGGLRFSDARTASGFDVLDWWVEDWYRFWGFVSSSPQTGTFAPRASEPRPMGPFRIRRLDQKLYMGNSVFGDFNNDGWLDYVQVARNGGSPDAKGHWRSIFFLNDGAGRFTPIKTEISGISEQGLSGRAVDLNDDGLLEFVLMRREEVTPQSPLMVFWNTGRQFGATENHWLRVRLSGAPDRALIGAKIFAVDPEGGTLLGRRDYFIDTMRGSQTPEAHFGLGRRARADVVVVLPDGRARRFTNVAVDRETTLDVTRGGDLGRAYSGSFAEFLAAAIR